MTHRERFRTVLRREIPDRLPLVARLDLWYTAAANEGTLPEEVRGLSIRQIEQRLGMGRSARFTDFLRPRFRGQDGSPTAEGERTTTLLRAPGRVLRQVLHTTPEHRRAGIRGHVTEYFLKSAEDYDALRVLWESAEWEYRQEEFRRFDEEVGEDGLPVIVLGGCPAHELMLRYAGYENFYLHMADFPDRVEALIGAIERRFEETWKQLARSPAEVILHGTHWSTDMTPRPVFRRWFLPYFRRFTSAMHAAGKQCGFHADSDLSGLLPEALESGMDLTECFASAPLVRLTLAEARAAWGDRIVMWGGIPSTLLLPSVALRKFRDYMDRFAEDVADGRAAIAGISDNLMPGSDWGRIVELAERVGRLRFAPHSAGNGDAPKS